MKEKRVLKTWEERQQEQKKLFQSVIKMIAIDKAVRTFGEKSVKWAITKYLTSVRTRDRLLKQKKDADAAIVELNRKLGM